MTTLADDLPQFGAERRQVRDLQGQNMPDETFAIGELEERFSMWRRGVHLSVRLRKATPRSRRPVTMLSRSAGTVPADLTSRIPDNRQASSFSAGAACFVRVEVPIIDACSDQSIPLLGRRLAAAVRRNAHVAGQRI
jgi:hypothetical protein